MDRRLVVGDLLPVGACLFDELIGPLLGQRLDLLNLLCRRLILKLRQYWETKVSFLALSA